MRRPTFSIITATLNAKDAISEIATSLASQTCRDFNWIVEDAQSTDGTLEEVSKYKSSVPELLIFSQKDSGVYDAWNKALDNAGDCLGDWCIFLGAGDSLANENVLAKVRELLLETSDEVKICTGSAIFISIDGIKTAYCIGSSEEAYKNLWWKMVANAATFYRRECLIAEKFDNTYKITGDYEFCSRVLKSARELKKIDFLVSYVRAGGLSESADGRNRVLCAKEHYRVFKTHHSGSVYKTAVALYYLYKLQCYVFLNSFPLGRGIILINRKVKGFFHRK